MKKLYRFNLYCGRSGSLHGLFVAEPDEVEKAIGKTVHFGEVLGKHSEVSCTLEAKHFTIATDDQTFIAKYEELGIGQQGTNPLATLADQEADAAGTEESDEDE